jgi:hypothetical protein
VICDGSVHLATGCTRRLTKVNTKHAHSYV